MLCNLELYTMLKGGNSQKSGLPPETIQHARHFNMPTVTQEKQHICKVLLCYSRVNPPVPWNIPIFSRKTHLPSGSHFFMPAGLQSFQVTATPEVGNSREQLPSRSETVRPWRFQSGFPKENNRRWGQTPIFQGRDDVKLTSRQGLNLRWRIPCLRVLGLFR